MGTHIVIRSLSFKSNKTKYGPYGTVAGQPFSYHTEGCIIVGFHGRAGDYVDAIGAYVKIMPKEVWSLLFPKVMFYSRTKGYYSFTNFCTCLIAG